MALFYTYIFFYIFTEAVRRKKCLIAFLLIGLTFYVFQILSNGFNLQVGNISLSSDFFYRNWLARGIPCVSLGVLIRQYKGRLLGIRDSYLYTTLFICSIWMIVVQFLFIHIVGIDIQDYICSSILVVTILVISEKHNNYFKRIRLLNNSGKITAYVYIFHVAVMDIYLQVLNFIGIADSTLVAWSLPIVVLVSSIIIAVIFNYMVVNLKKFKEQKEARL